MCEKFTFTDASCKNLSTKRPKIAAEIWIHGEHMVLSFYGSEMYFSRVSEWRFYDYFYRAIKSDIYIRRVEVVSLLFWV